MHGRQVEELRHDGCAAVHDDDLQPVGIAGVNAVQRRKSAGRGLIVDDDGSAEDARQMLSEDFRSGKGQVTDLLAAEEGLRNAELGVLGARYQKIRACAALRVALGMDLIEEGSK